MAAKVLTLILVLGVSAVSLLSMRQARLQAAHDMARSLERLQLIEHERWAARARLSELMDPARLEPDEPPARDTNAGAPDPRGPGERTEPGAALPGEPAERTAASEPRGQRSESTSPPTPIEVGR